jgi:hypothetical protein
VEFAIAIRVEPQEASIGFCSRIGKSLSRSGFCGRFWLTM